MHALAQPLREEGWQIDADALAQVVDVTGGYPYAVQLYGYHTVEAAGPAATITADHMRDGIRAGMQQLDDGLYRARWAKLPDRERHYLAAMAVIDPVRPVSTREIAETLGKRITELSDVRARLLDWGIIVSLQRGTVQCTLPGFLDHITRRHPDTIDGVC